MTKEVSKTQAAHDTDRFVAEVMKRVLKNADEMFSDQDGSGYWASKPNIHIDRQSLKSLFYSSDWVYILVNLIATKISNQRLIVTEKKVTDGVTLFAPATDHELQTLLDQPNPRQSQGTLVYNWVADLTLGGNGLVYHAEPGDTLHNVAFERISPLLKPDTDELLGYYISTDMNCDPTGDNVIRFGPDEILHAMKPDPSACWWGLSPFIPGRAGILFAKYSQEFLNSFYLKGATPQLALEMDSDVNEKGAMRLLRSFEKAYTGRENSRRPLVTPKGVTVKPITTTLADQQLITYINSNRETLINLLAIPKHELSLQDGGGLGSQEMRLSLRNFWLTTLKPTMAFIEGSLNSHFRERLGTDHDIKFDLSGVEALQDDEVKKAELADRLIKAGVMTPNEVRQKVFKMSPHIDGDVLQITIGRGLQEQPPPVLEPSERPPDNEPIRALLGGSTKEAIVLMRKEREEEEQKPRNYMAALVQGVLAKYLDILIPLMQTELEGLVPEKADTRLTSATIKLNRKIEKAMQKLQDQYVERYGEIARPAVDSGHAAVLTASFGPVRAGEINLIANEKRRIEFLWARGIESFKGLNKTSTSQVMADIKKGVESNSSLQEITRNVSTKFAEGAEFRAERISRTEVGVATMAGREAAFGDAQEVLGKVNKVWITAGDADVRESHESLDNVPANADGEWVTDAGNVLAYPLDPSAEPEERIGCRCDMIFVED